MFRAVRSVVSLALLSFLSVNEVFSQNKIPSVRIVQIEAFDEGTTGTIGSGTAQVDLVQDQCNADSEDSATAEPFSDTIVAVHVENGSNERLVFNKIAFTVVKGGSDGRSFTTKRLAPIGGGEVEAGESKTLYGFLLKANDTVKLAPTKKGAAALSTGFKTVRAIRIGKSAFGKRYRLRASTTLSFSNYDRCSS